MVNGHAKRKMGCFIAEGGRNADVETATEYVAPLMAATVMRLRILKIVSS
jgi:hypothetical protein